jgi:ketosteroid isomerase-like protein
MSTRDTARMEAASVDLVRRVYAAWNHDDWATLAELLDPDCELRPVLGVPEETVFFGLEGVKAYRDVVEGLLGRMTGEPVEILRADDRHVVLLGHITARGAESGVELDQHFVYLWTIRGGRVTAMQSFASEDDAVAAIAGTPPPAVRQPEPARDARPSRGAAARARPGA